MSFAPGDVIHVYCAYIDPPHFKYAACICQKTPLFFFINTEPRRGTPDAQILIKKEWLPCLTHDSYINTATVVTFPKTHLSQSKIVGALPELLKAKIKSQVQKHKYLPPRHVNLVTGNF